MKQFLLSLVLTTLSIAFAAQVQAEERTVIEILRGTKAQAAERRVTEPEAVQGLSCTNREPVRFHQVAGGEADSS